ncbi:hypothetical protein GCM10010255_62310 [Streptomyces coeruleofuscus]|uniref:Transposase IS701-like DDE domain-containing protein n=1 Tax=Streptomyces coeruleofuscus TaxID=66879 RepID=A0ABP5W0J8_9ACTN
MQQLLGRARWDADAVRDDVREHVLEHLHDDGALLVDDETGDIKQGTHTVGAQRQYTGHRREDRKRASRCLPRLRGTARARGGGPGAVHTALLDVRPERCRAAGLDEDTVFWTRTPSSRPSRSRPPS